MCTNCGDPTCDGPGTVRDVGGMHAETTVFRHTTDPTKVRVTIVMTFPGVKAESELAESTIRASAAHALNSQMRIKGMSVALNGVVYGEAAFKLAKQLDLPGVDALDEDGQHTMRESEDGGRTYKTLTAVDQVETSGPPAVGSVQDGDSERERLNKMFQKVFGARPVQRGPRKRGAASEEM